MAITLIRVTAQLASRILASGRSTTSDAEADSWYEHDFRILPDLIVNDKIIDEERDPLNRPRHGLGQPG